MKKIILSLILGYFMFSTAKSQYLHITSAHVNIGASTPSVYFKMILGQYNFDRITLTSFNDSTNTQIIRVYFKKQICAETTGIRYFDSLFSINAFFPFKLKLYGIVDTFAAACPTFPTSPLYLDSFIVNANQIIALPLSNIDISIQKVDKRVLLNWRVNDETDIKNYVVEKADRNQNFISVQSILPTATKEYKWFDELPSSQENYYRIKAFSKNGSYKYSSVVNIKSAVSGMFIYPNPVLNREIKLNWDNVENEELNLLFYSTDGKLAFSKTISVLGNSINKILLPQNLSKGIYCFKTTISNSLNTFQQLIFIQ